MQPKTYLLSPDFTLHPGGKLALGNVVADPFRPLRPLGKLPSPPEVVTHPEVEVSFTKKATKSFHSKIFAAFLETASANISGDVAKSVTHTFEIDALDTLYFDNEITEEEATSLINEDAKIRSYSNSGTFGKQPVYVVTGLKVARGFRHIMEESNNKSGQLGGSAPIVEGVSAGAEVGTSRERGFGSTTSSKVDLIFAYQLHKIAEKGWRESRKRVESAVFVHKAGFLGKGDKDVADAYEAGLLSEEDFQDLVEEDSDADIEDLTFTVVDDASSADTLVVSFRARD
ncbi:Hypothetical protein D9617_23g005390 [Elsinoe fawcettii]|nr:Hypothetical protein D9617_23g005390 [Elsinoe fawcettii]